MARKVRTYFTLLMKDGTPGENPWCIAFGDYDRQVVADELQDYRDHGWKARELKIVETHGHGQKEIDAVLAKLNKAETGASPHASR